MDDPNIKKLQVKVKELGQTINSLQETLTEKNKLVDSLHYVWCSGGCDTGVHRYCSEPVTLELVELAETNATRLRHWYNNYNAK